MMVRHCVLVLCCFFLFSTQSSAVRFESLSDIMCPHRDYSSNICYRLTSYNKTCLWHPVVTCDDQNRNFASWLHDLPNIEDRDLSWVKNLSSEFFPSTRLCRREERVNCTAYRCTKYCCDDRRMDDLGRCNHDTSNERCANGGTFNGYTDLCICRDGFSGPTCETPVCDHECLHGGICEKRYPRNLCNCPPPRYGPYCEQVRCPHMCENGGVCAVDGNDVVCVCPDGFYGKTCSHARNPPGCPPINSTVCTDFNCLDKCRGFCRHGQICCSDGCCQKCVDPVPRFCMLNGLKVMPGQHVQKDKCTICTCLLKGKLYCTTMQCPRNTCPHGTERHDHDTCCPVCDNNKVTPPNYKVPRFTNCRNNQTMSLTVNQYRNSQVMSALNIEARDYRNRWLQVRYDPRVVEHCRCFSFDRVPVYPVLTTSDDYTTVQCYPRVYVVDRSPPVFRNCPSDIYAFEGEVVSWQTPYAYDNVGVQPLTTGSTMDRVYPVGNHTISYVASDFDDNRAICEFTIFVTDADTDETFWPPELQARKKNSGSVIVGSITGSVVFIVMVVLVVIVIRYRHRQGQRGCSSRTTRSSAARPPADPIRTVSNGLYGSGNHGTLFDAIPETHTPPLYNSTSDEPPSYEEIEATSPPKYDDVMLGYSGHVYDIANNKTIYDNPSFTTTSREVDLNTSGSQPEFPTLHTDV